MCQFIFYCLQEFESNGSHDLDKSRTTGSLKTKLKFPDHGTPILKDNIDIDLFNLGVTFTEEWSTGADMSTELKYEPAKVAGLKLGLNGGWTANSG